MNNHYTILNPAITAAVLAGQEILKIYNDPESLADCNENKIGEEHPQEVQHKYSIKTITEYPEGLTLSLSRGNGYGAIILAVAHNEFLKRA